MRDESGALTGFSKVAHDVTDRKRANELLEAKVKERTAQLQASLSSVEQLLYTIAHDLRRPNRHMRSFAQLLLLEHADRLDDQARDYLSRIGAAAARNDELIATCSSTDGCRTKRFRSRRWISGGPSRRCCRRWRGKSRTATRMFSSARSGARGGERALARENPDQFRDQRPHLRAACARAEMLISAESEGGKAVLRVQDNGIGFHRSRSTGCSSRSSAFRMRPTPGHGHGLAIVKKAAERLNGAVGADSTLGKGSCFWLELQAA